MITPGVPVNPTVPDAFGVHQPNLPVAIEPLSLGSIWHELLRQPVEVLQD
jgi:hypothetical protein